MKLKIFLIFFFSLFHLFLFSQENKKSKDNSNLTKAVKNLKESLEKNSSDDKVAKDYVSLANEFAKNNDYEKAEDYYTKAKQIYERLKDKDKVANMSRQIAKMQEAQNKLSQAISSYQLAEENAMSGASQIINKNDILRLKNSSNSSKQIPHIQENISLLQSSSEKKDLSTAYQQLASAYVSADNRQQAISVLEGAAKELKDMPEEAIEINRKMAEVYVSQRDFDKAIEINRNILAEAKKINNPQIELEQLRTLSNTYFDNNNAPEGLSSLQEAYNISIEEGHINEAKKSLLDLVDRYKSLNKKDDALNAYNDFVEHLDTLIKKDNSLVDQNILLIHEQKISQLENERTFQNELIERKNTFNYVLIGFVVVILLFLFFIVKVLYSIKKKNKEIALQSLRREMNPHFIFNSLNSVNQFIAQNKELEANKYLTSYSMLMRNIMENSNKDFIPLAVEINQLNKYLELEYMRFGDKFKYSIDIDSSIDVDSVFVPNMLIQPQLENAIWHGLRYSDREGFLQLVIVEQKDRLSVKIEDNGIGREKSKDLKTKHQKKHKSRGLTNTKERINLLNDLYKCNIKMDILDKDGDSGVIVLFSFPLITKNYTK